MGRILWTPPPRQETMDSEPEGSLNAGPLVDEVGKEITSSEAAMDKHRTTPPPVGKGSQNQGLKHGLKHMRPVCNGVRFGMQLMTRILSVQRVLDLLRAS